MELNIAGKDTEIIFGMAFIRELDSIYKVEGNGIVFGTGLESILPGLFTDNPTVLGDVIYHGTAHVKKGRPSKHQIDNLLESISDLDELEKLFEDVIHAMSESVLIKKKVVAFKTEAEAAEKALGGM